jgi:integrase
MERPGRQAPRQSLPDKGWSIEVPAQGAGRRSSGKKSPDQRSTIAAIAQTWAKNAPPHKPHRLVAAALTSAAGSLMPQQLNQLTIDGLVARWRTEFAPATLYSRAGILRQLLRSLHEFGAPILTVPRIKPGRPRARVATPEEIQRLLNATPAHYRLFILLCWQTGLRHSEALAVTPRSYNQENRTVTVKVKGGATRTVPVTNEIAALIHPTLHGDPDESCVFLLRGRKLSKASIYSAWARICRQTKIEGLRPHDLRRTVANAVLDTTGDLRDVQAYLGHENLRSTAHYIVPFGDRRVRELQQLLKFNSEVRQ